MANEERKEDLNQRPDEIEEKIRQMLDPSIPDESNTPSVPDATNKTTVPVISGVATPAEPDQTPSAPELPTAHQAKDAQPTTTKSRKVIVPITHIDAAATATDQSSSPPTVRKIAVSDPDETPEQVAEKLDEVVAELTPKKSAPKPKKTKVVVKEPASEEPETEPAPPESDNKPVDETKDQAEPTADQESPPDAPELPAEEQELTEEPLAPPLEAVADSQDKPITELAVIADPATDKVVDDIMAEESDKLLETTQQTPEPAKPPEITKPKPHPSKKRKKFWSRASVRWATFLLVLTGLLAGVFMPTARYFLLNHAGVRSRSSLTVIDDSTQQPLKNATVSINNVEAQTDAEGKVQLQNIKLGEAALTISKRAFTSITKTIIIGWGSNPLGDFELTPTGTQYEIDVVDYLSDKPVKKVEAENGEASALSDDAGVIKLTVGDTDATTIDVTVKAAGYRQETLSIHLADTKARKLRLVPSRKHIFISKSSGKYDVYAVYVDGQAKKLILAGTGNETSDAALIPHPTDEVAAYVSARSGHHGSNGSLLNDLLVVGPATQKATSVTSAERIQIIGWSGDYLIFVKTSGAASAAKPDRSQLITYNYQNSSSKQIANSSYFNDVLMADGKIYYAPASATSGATAANFYQVEPDGSQQTTLLSKETWNIFRSSYDELNLSVQQQWYLYGLGDAKPTKQNGAPNDQTSRVYVDSPDGTLSAWVDQRDGKGVVLVYDKKTKAEKTVSRQNGLTYPISWLSPQVVVFRVADDQETADYAVSLDGGKPVKLSDVTNAAGLDRWYYY